MEAVYLNGFIKLLQDILGTLFDAVLSPVLRDVFSILVNIFGALIQDILSGFLLQIWIIFLKLVNFMESIFNVFSGVSNVEVKDVSGRIPLLEYFFRLETVQRVFLVITAIAVILAFLTTLFGVIKSMSDMALENKSPLSAVLKQAMKAAISFLLIPLTCLFILQMTTRVIVVVNSAFSYQLENTTLGDTLFYSVASPAGKSNADYKSFEANQKFEDADAVKRSFDISEFNYFQAYISSVAVALILLVSILQFIQRIIMIIVLYLVSPFFVSAMPLDGGAKFREWRNMFVAHMLSAFGPIISMKLYLMLVPMIAGAEIGFGVSGTAEAWMKLFFIIGGAWAVYKARLLIISVLNPAAAGHMAQSGVLGAMVGGKVMGKLHQAKHSFAGGGSRAAAQKPQGQQSGGADQYKTQSQAYTGK
ncbi:MAG: hypothetical protein Q4C63_03090 [Eubacteriales bacterium]|nr:hypothetical protein [Eubacteriales bacterium]